MRYWFSFIFLFFSSQISIAKDLKPITLVCVDCFSSATLYAKSAQRIAGDRPIQWILVQTYRYDPYYENMQSLAFPPSSEKLFIDPSNETAVDTFLETLKNRGVKRVIGGMDQGMYHASLWNQHLGAKDNDPALRDARRKKFEMSKMVGQYSIPTQLVKDAGSSLKFLDDNPTTTAVLKLNAGVASIGLQMVPTQNRQQLKIALETATVGIAGTTGAIDSFVVQPKIQGTEYYAQTFSVDGKTYLTGLWQYYKIPYGNSHLYFVDRPLSLKGAVAKELHPILSKINLSLGLTQGPAHIEMMRQEKTNKWYLIENNGRVVGSGIPELEREIYGISHLDLYMLSVLDPAKMQAELDTFPRRMVKDGFVFNAPVSFHGELTSEAIKNLESFPSYFLPGEQYKLRPKDDIVPTTNLVDAAFVLHAAGETRQVQKDFRKMFSQFIAGEIVRPRPPPAAPLETTANRCNAGLSASAKAGDFLKHMMSTVREIRW